MRSYPFLLIPGPGFPEAHIAILGTLTLVDQSDDPLRVAKARVACFDLFFPDPGTVLIADNFDRDIVPLVGFEPHFLSHEPFTFCRLGDTGHLLNPEPILGDI